jgi:hypothetical protein
VAADSAGNLFISYYDVDNGDLKFIARYNGTWTQPMTIDGSSAGGTPTGDVGLYSSIALNSQGVPAIAYFRRGSYDSTVQAETGTSTALIYAVAKSSRPASATDWLVVGDVDQLNKPAQPCGAGCPSGQLCVDEGGGQNRCAKPAPAVAPCNPGCTGSQACVVSADGNSSVCRASLQANLLLDLPLGVGLTPSLAFLDDKAVIAYYDSVNHALKAVAAAAGGASPAFGAPVFIDGNDAPPPAPAVAKPRDTGRFPSIAIGKSGQTGGRIAIAFQDVTNQVLLLYQADALIAHAAHDSGSTGVIHIIDNGQPDASEAWHPQSFPGVQSSSAFTASGNVIVAYQDATPVALKLATWDPSKRTASRVAVRTTGAAGFWPRLALDGTTAYMTSATIKAATAQISGNQMVVDSKTAP